jgi:hypothetical protein
VYEGTKISAAGFGIPSPDLPDTSPVISISIVNVGTIRNNPGLLTPPPLLLTPPVVRTNPNSGPRNNTGYSNAGFNVGAG